jgi:tellurite resistance protein
VLQRLERGVYARSEVIARLADDERSRRILATAVAVALVGPDAAASHLDAALLHGLAVLDRPGYGPIAVSHPTGATGNRTRRSTIRAHPTSLPASHVTIARGVPVTSVARTVIDIARTTPLVSGVVVADSALHASKTTKAALMAVLATCQHWPGLERARQVAEFADGRAESALESISRLAFRDGGLPPPDLQVNVGSDERPIGRADFLWRKHSTIAEADGALKYADPMRAIKQLRRDADLREAGFEVVHFTWQEITRTPDQVVGAIRAAFRRALVLREAERDHPLAG